MKRHFFALLFVLAGTIGLCAPPVCAGPTAKEIMEQAFKPKVGQTFRVALHIKTIKKGKKQPGKIVWVMGKVEAEMGKFFLDFEEPEESKGMRFLVLLKREKKPDAYMYLPAAKRTLPIDVDDRTTDLGGTGLTVEDIQMFGRRPEGEPKLVEHEKIRGRHCYVIESDLEGTEHTRRLWITKDQFLMIQSQNVSPDGKPIRTFRVVEFFTTNDGKELPREEVITVPGKDLRIRVRQEHAVFGIEIPDELFDPETFGTYRWRI